MADCVVRLCWMPGMCNPMMWEFRKGLQCLVQCILDNDIITLAHPNQRDFEGHIRPALHRL